MKAIFRILGTAAAVAATGAAIVIMDKLLNEKAAPIIESIEFPEEAEKDDAEAAKTAEAYAEGEAKAEAEAAAPAEETAPAEEPAAPETEAAPAEAAEPVTLPDLSEERPVCDPEAPNPNPVEAGPAVAPKDENGKYIQFNASKGVILATGDYMNNEAMVKRWCPDVDGYDKKQYQKTGDGHIMAIDAGAKMENLGHTKMMHDFDSGLMYEEPFLYVNMEGKRFCNEDTGFVYMGNITKYLPRYNGANVDANHPDGSLGWYCQIYDSDYMSYANSPVPEQVMTKYIPGAVENPQGVFTNLIDTYKADTIEELAALLDVPADELQKTIDRYNELCDQGTDADFGKKSAYMHKIEKAPFWGVRKHIRVSSIDSGVNTNANGQALDADGKVIEGLYCVGNVGGVFYGGADYPFHQTGLSLGRCYTFGMLAAKHAMGK